MRASYNGLLPQPSKLVMWVRFPPPAPKITERLGTIILVHTSLKSVIWLTIREQEFKADVEREI